MFLAMESVKPTQNTEDDLINILYETIDYFFLYNSVSTAIAKEQFRTYSETGNLFSESFIQNTKKKISDLWEKAKKLFFRFFSFKKTSIKKDKQELKEYIQEVKKNNPEEIITIEIPTPPNEIKIKGHTIETLADMALNNPDGFMEAISKEPDNPTTVYNAEKFEDFMTTCIDNLNEYEKTVDKMQDSINDIDKKIKNPQTQGAILENHMTSGNNLIKLSRRDTGFYSNYSNGFRKFLSKKK